MRIEAGENDINTLHTTTTYTHLISSMNPISTLKRTASRALTFLTSLSSATLLVTTTIATTAHAGWSTFGQLSEVQPNPRHAGILVGHERSTNSDWGGCNNNDYFILSQSNAFYQPMQSLITSSFLNDTEVDLYVEGCLSGYPEIKKVKVQQ